MEIIMVVLYISAFILLYLTITFVVLFALKHNILHFKPKDLEDKDLKTLSVVLPVQRGGGAEENP